MTGDNVIDAFRTSKSKFDRDASQLRKLHIVKPDEQRPVTDTKGFRLYKVSAVGQMTLPASARQRWGLKAGGRVSVADLGYAIVVVPERGTHQLLHEVGFFVRAA